MIYQMRPEITQLLFPISPQTPAGENLEDEILFDEIRSARISDPADRLDDEWAVREPRKADWARVRFLCEQSLMEKSKDLQLVCWLVEALFHLHNLVGLVWGIDFITAFIGDYWETCWPSPEEDRTEIRRGILLRLDRDLSQSLYHLPLLHQRPDSLSRWRHIQAFEHRIKASPDTREMMIAQEGDLSMATFELQAADIPFAEIRQQDEYARQLKASLGHLETRYASLSHDSEGPVFLKTSQIVDDIIDYLQTLTKFTPPANELMEQHSVDDNMSSTAYTNPQIQPQIMNRVLAINQMLAIANYFRQSEPTSPVPFLMERAARWANMTLTEWLEEMLTDNNSINEINNVLTGQSR